MKIDFTEDEYLFIPGLNGGEGKIGAKMHAEKGLKAIKSVIPVGASIGLHAHETSIDFNYVVSGEGMAVCDGVEEKLSAGDVHYCPLGSTHSLKNTGNKDLVLITFVPELTKNGRDG